MKSKTLQLNNVPEQDGWGIILSLVLHGLLLLSIVLYQQFFVSSRQIFTPSYQSVSLVGSAPVTQAPPKPAPPKPQPEAPKPTPPKPQPEPSKPVAPKPEPVKPAPEPIKPTPRPDSGKELEERLQAMQREQEQRRAREAEKQRQAREAERARQEQQDVEEAIARLQQGQAGRAGGAPSQIDPRLQAYNQQLHDLIHRNWVVPEGINARGLVVVINFNIRRDGHAERIWIEQSSGNPVYDQSGLRAAEKANPFPPPPSVMRSPIYEVGIRFTYGG